MAVAYDKDVRNTKVVIGLFIVGFLVLSSMIMSCSDTSSEQPNEKQAQKVLNDLNRLRSARKILTTIKDLTEEMQRASEIGEYCEARDLAEKALDHLQELKKLSLEDKETYTKAVSSEERVKKVYVLLSKSCERTK